MFWAKPHRTDVLISKTGICYYDNEVKYIQWNNDIFDRTIPYLSGCECNLYADGSLACQTVLSAENEQEVISQLQKALSVRSPQLYDISFQDNGTAVVIWFPELKAEKIQHWAASQHASILSLDSVLNRFSFLCRDNAHILVDLDDHIAVIEKEGCFYKNMFSVSICTADDVEDSLKELSRSSQYTVYSTRVKRSDNIKLCSDFSYNKHHYTIDNWKKCIVWGDVTC